MRYGIDERPPLSALLLYGVQWWVVTLPSVIIIGVVAARLHGAAAAAQIWYLQKLFAFMGAATLVQIFAGHRLPLVAGPASTLLVGLVASLAAGANALYTAIALGGCILAIAGFTGLLARLRGLFSPRVVIVVLLLIAITMTPTILRLIGSGSNATFSFSFALVAAFALVCCNHWLRGIYKALTVILGMLGGSLAYCLFQGFPEISPATHSLAVPLSWTITPEFDPGTILAFIFCFLALTVNEIGSIESVGQMLKVDGMAGRIRRGSGVTGLANLVAGGLGVIGPVDFSMSVGIIAATGCASRFAFIPAGAGLILCAFFPGLIAILSAIPGPVMGTLLLYLMATQLASGLVMLAADRSIHSFSSTIIVALSLMIGLTITFAPASAFAAFPDLLRPVIGNGFVMGIVAVLVLEHGVFRQG